MNEWIVSEWDRNMVKVVLDDAARAAAGKEY